MNIVEVLHVPSETKILSFTEVASFINLMYHDLVEELLEAFENITDFELILEVIDILNLNYYCVTNENCFQGFIKGVDGL